MRCGIPENALSSLCKQVPGRLIVVFGCGGDRDREKRPLMAKVAEEIADYVLVTTDNPRSESIDEINQQIISGFKQESYSVYIDRQDAITAAVEMAVSGDCVLVAGKGHENTQIFSDGVKEFDDLKVLSSALKNKGQHKDQGAALC